MKSLLNTQNRLEVSLNKPSTDFTRNDIVRFMEESNISMLNFLYPGEDGKLKNLNFAIENIEHLNHILTYGERVDGSSIFKHVSNGASDLYVIPMYRTAFVDPFAEIPTLSVLCTYFKPDGTPLETAPQYVMQRAYDEMQKRTGYQFKMLAELEYYIKAPIDNLYKGTDQRGYHASEPFAKYSNIRQEAIDILMKCGGKVKYAHAEVGTFYTDENMYEQHEIEFLPEEPELAVLHLLLAKWILRMICKREKLVVSWSPKICQGKAGSGLHFHMQLEKEGKNCMLKDGELSKDARKVIAGIMDMADVLTAFGNTVPTSYLRLVPGQEAPTYICWGFRNRSALVRVPLGWTVKTDMAKLANPLETENASTDILKQTVEFRVPDGSADVYLLVSGLITAATHGLTLENAEEIAETTFVSQYIFDPSFAENLKKLKQLPSCCKKSGERLLEKRELLEQFGAFTPELTESVAHYLIGLDDENMSEKAQKDSKFLDEIVEEYMDVM